MANYINNRFLCLIFFRNIDYADPIDRSVMLQQYLVISNVLDCKQYAYSEKDLEDKGCFSVGHSSFSMLAKTTAPVLPRSERFQLDILWLDNV